MSDRVSSCHLFGGPFRGVTFGGSGVSIGGVGSLRARWISPLVLSIPSLKLTVNRYLFIQDDYITTIMFKLRWCLNPPFWEAQDLKIDAFLFQMVPFSREKIANFQGCMFAGFRGYCGYYPESPFRFGVKKITPVTTLELCHGHCHLSTV